MEPNNLQAPRAKPGNIWNKIIYKPPGQTRSPMEPNDLQAPRANQVTYGTKEFTSTQGKPGHLWNQIIYKPPGQTR